MGSGWTFTSSNVLKFRDAPYQTAYYFKPVQSRDQPREWVELSPPQEQTSEVSYLAQNSAARPDGKLAIARDYWHLG
jgi:hypothetical protein